MEPKILNMTENYNAEIARLKEKIHMHEQLREEHEKHSMQLRDRLLKASHHSECVIHAVDDYCGFSL